MSEDSSPLAPGADNLSKYRAKRSADTSPEPVGRVATDEGRLFVVHKHAASRLHWDLRLPRGGVTRVIRTWRARPG